MFKAMFSGGFKESSDNAVVVLDYSFLSDKTVLMMVEYIYLGTLRIPKKCDIDQLEEIIHASDYFGLTELTKWLLGKVTSYLLTKFNVKEIVNRFDRFDSEGIIKEEIQDSDRFKWHRVKDYEDFSTFVFLLDQNYLPQLSGMKRADISESLIKQFHDIDPELYYHFEFKHRSVNNYGWILALLSSHYNDTKKLTRFQNSLLQYLEKIEPSNPQFFNNNPKGYISIDIDDIKHFMTSSTSHRLMTKIFLKLKAEILIVMKKSSLLKQAKEHIELVNNFIMDHNNLEIKGLHINGGLFEADDSFTLDDTYSLHLLVEMLVEVNNVEFTYELPYTPKRYIIETVLEKLTMFLRRKSNAESHIKLQTMIVRHGYLTEFHHLLYDVSSILKKFHLVDVHPYQLTHFLRLPVPNEQRDSLESLVFRVNKTENEACNRRMIPTLFKYWGLSRIKEISFANSFVSGITVSDMVNVGKDGMFWPKTLETLVLCGVKFIDFGTHEEMERKSKELLKNMAKLVALLPNVTIGKCTNLCSNYEDLELLKSSIKSVDKETGNLKAEQIGLVRSGENSDDDDDDEWVYIMYQNHYDNVCSVCNPVGLEVLSQYKY